MKDHTFVVDIDHRTVADAAIFGSTIRFINHANSPSSGRNVVGKTQVHRGMTTVAYIAERDITTGEELLSTLIILLLSLLFRLLGLLTFQYTVNYGFKHKNKSYWLEMRSSKQNWKTKARMTKRSRLSPMKPYKSRMIAQVVVAKQSSHESLNGFLDVRAMWVHVGRT